VFGGPAALTWFDRAGRDLGVVTAPGYYRYATLSPDGRRVAVTFSANGQSFDVWQIDLDRTLPTRFTFNNDDDFWPVVWSSDSRYIAFASRHQQSGKFDLYRRLAAGGQADELLFHSPEPKYPSSFSPDGKLLLFNREMGPGRNTDVWALPLTGNREPVPVVSTPFNEGAAVFSPDGRWIAYVSNDTGSWQVYVQRFPTTDARWRLSTTTGTWPMWTRGGREVVYATTGQEFMAVDITVIGSELRASVPRRLFLHPYVGGGWNHFVSQHRSLDHEWDQSGHRDNAKPQIRRALPRTWPDCRAFACASR
jgi:Tol biopolymer transport system component